MRIRKAFAAAFGVVCVASTYLGFADISLKHDKFLHFTTFFLLSLLCYWILDAPRKRCINITAIICTVIGGVGSEFVQSIVNSDRQFDIYDIFFNVVGSVIAIGLSAWYHKRLLDRKREARYKLLRSNVSNATSQPTELQDIEAQAGLEPSSSSHGASGSNDDPVLLKEVEPEPLS